MLRRRAADARGARQRRSSCRRSSGSCWPLEGFRPAARRAAWRAARPSRPRRLRPRGGRRAVPDVPPGRVPISPRPLALMRRHPRRRLAAALAEPPSAGHPRGRAAGRPRPWSTTSSAGCAVGMLGQRASRGTRYLTALRRSSAAARRAWTRDAGPGPMPRRSRRPDQRRPTGDGAGDERPAATGATALDEPRPGRHRRSGQGRAVRRVPSLRWSTTVSRGGASRMPGTCAITNRPAQPRAPLRLCGSCRATDARPGRQPLQAAGLRVPVGGDLRRLPLDLRLRAPRRR